MKVGAEPRKLAILGVLAVVAAYTMYSNFFGEDTSRPPAPAQPPAAAPARAPATQPGQSAAATPSPARLRGVGTQEFRPVLRPLRPEDRPDPASMDPTLRLNSLAKVQAATVGTIQRSLFEFSAPPPPKTPEPKIVPKPPPVAENTPFPSGSESSKPAAKPPPPPIPLKFYGFSNPAGRGRARGFFLDGEEISIAGEGDVIKKRYKIIRIGNRSAVIEDLDHQHQQTIAIEQETG